MGNVEGYRPCWVSSCKKVWREHSDGSKTCLDCGKPIEPVDGAKLKPEERL